MKNKHIHIKASDEDKTKLKALAKKAKTNQSEFARNAIFGKDIIVIDGLKELNTQLKYIGNNLNQLTTRANMGHFDTINFEELKLEFSKIHEKLAELCEQKYRKDRR